MTICFFIGFITASITALIHVGFAGYYDRTQLEGTIKNLEHQIMMKDVIINSNKMEIARLDQMFLKAMKEELEENDS